ncbi:hypothetical protein EW146_g3308 [Bondarzewia mesenterica]|uniref:Uncharacterized protein n=1 Tax=Bondarzewia mesenterica TaxID=1095465 RepID=A0A4S4M3V4_9AGAM|nr:hypothetical protein EW146_g3308 [Bondarzewia mesenterica]
MDNESTFVAPEGVYSVTEDHKPIPITHNAPTPLFPTRLSTIVVRFSSSKGAPSPGLTQLLGGSKDFWKDMALSPKEDGLSVSSGDTRDEGTSPDPSNAQESLPPTPIATQDQHHGLFSHPPAGKKKSSSRPKHNMRTTSSTFITRLHSVEGLSKTLQSKQGDVTFLFYNSAKNFYWIETGSKSKVRLTLASGTSDSHIFLRIPHMSRCFNTGDLVWFGETSPLFDVKLYSYGKDPMSSRYGRLNKQGRISNSPCTAVRWVPSSPNLFLVSHADGTIMVYDKERDDGVFTPQDPNSLPSTSSPVDLNPPANSSPAGATPTGGWNPLDSIFVTIPPWHPVNGGSGTSGIGSKGDKDKDKAARNPVSHWKVSKRSVVDFVFSPDVKYVAAISEDGCLRVIDALAEQLVDCYAAYFGSLTSVAWSPDGRFIITGGQDDLVNIFSPWEQRVIARCQGHSSFVSAVAFDDVRCDGRTYRFGSVGEDNKLILVSSSPSSILRTLHSKISTHSRPSKVGLFQRSAPPTEVATNASAAAVHGVFDLACTSKERGHGRPFHAPSSPAHCRRTSPALPPRTVEERGRRRATCTCEAAGRRHSHRHHLPPPRAAHRDESRTRQAVDTPSLRTYASAEEWASYRVDDLGQHRMICRAIVHVEDQ